MEDWLKCQITFLVKYRQFEPNAVHWIVCTRIVYVLLDDMELWIEMNLLVSQILVRASCYWCTLGLKSRETNIRRLIFMLFSSFIVQIYDTYFLRTSIIILERFELSRSKRVLVNRIVFWDHIFLWHRNCIRSVHHYQTLIINSIH